MNEYSVLLILRDLKGELARVDWAGGMEVKVYEEFESRYNQCVVKLGEINGRIYGGLPTYPAGNGNGRFIGQLDQRNLKNRIDQVIELITLFNPEKKDGTDGQALGAMKT